MSFVHPWAIWLGLGAAALPIVVHLLTRPKPVRLPLSTLKFVKRMPWDASASMRGVGAPRSTPPP